MTHLQYAIIRIIGNQEVSGTDIREKIKQKFGDPQPSLPAFYQLIGRMEDAKLVSGRYLRIDKGDVHKRERLYNATVYGATQRDLTDKFYSQFSI